MVSLMAVGASTASSSTFPGDGQDRDKKRVIELTLTFTGGSELPANPPAGTVYTEFGTSALTKTGQPYGTWGYQGVVLVNQGGGVTQEQAVGTFNTPEGQITAQGLNPRNTLRQAITGGTGKFKQASGYVSLEGTGETVTLHIFQP
ncbi:hypothetical protein [Streptomyces sp. I6]|uniref:hypothetical protein n=1 Tax=Streptomyces sp. I6 TaxID=2483113 RepID=UPI0028802A7C|nr:hypothetical protein [Streptomyces sp. I6]